MLSSQIKISFTITPYVWEIKAVSDHFVSQPVSTAVVPLTPAPKIQHIHSPCHNSDLQFRVKLLDLPKTLLYRRVRVTVGKLVDGEVCGEEQEGGRTTMTSCFQ